MHGPRILRDTGHDQEKGALEVQKNEETEKDYAESLLEEDQWSE